MAEKGTLIIDQAGGESIATRDATLDDNNLNARVVQLTDLAARPVPFVAVADGTGHLRSVTVSDSNIVDPLPAAISANLLDVSDAESIVIYAEVACDGTSGGTVAGKVTITPLYIGEVVTPGSGSGSGTITYGLAAIGQPFSLHPIKPKLSALGAVQGDFIQTQSGGGGPDAKYPTLIQSIKTHGANSVGFHVNIDNNSGINITAVRLFAFKTSCADRNTADDQATISGTWGGDSFIGENS